MKHVKNALVADRAAMEPGTATPKTNVNRKVFQFFFFAPLLALAMNSCGLEETYYDRTDQDALAPGCKIIQDAIICPCTTAADTTLIG